MVLEEVLGWCPWLCVCVSEVLVDVSVGSQVWYFSSRGKKWGFI